MGANAVDEKEYLTMLPAALPADGRVLVHNNAPPSRRLRGGKFRAWLQPPSEALEQCCCGWGPEFGAHFRVAQC
jgi:hypothetical protein